jgi:hypothetical protein
MSRLRFFAKNVAYAAGTLAAFSGVTVAATQTPRNQNDQQKFMMTNVCVTPLANDNGSKNQNSTPESPKPRC